ncbi:MAG: hypothetical protein ACI9FB_001215 [Candidatus Azotimanducaceae bacterium]|jgi:hypothetical protein
MNTPSIEVVDAVLRGHYTPPKAGSDICEQDALRDVLQNLPALSTDEHIDPILTLIEQYHPHLTILPKHYATIAFVDDCITKLLRQTDVDFKIEAFIRNLAPFVAQFAIRKNATAVMQEQPILRVIDTLMHECLGWSEDLGILGEQFIIKVDSILREFSKGRSDISDCEKNLKSFFEKESVNYKKREERLTQSQLSNFQLQKGRLCSALLLNKLMQGKQLPLFIIFMLQGSWFEYLQEIFNLKGEGSKEWGDVSHLTKSIILTLQLSTDENQRLQLLNQLPSKLNELVKRLAINTTEIDKCIEDIVAEFEAVAKNEASPPCDFELLETEISSLPISKFTKTKIAKITCDQWFLFDDKDESDEKVARIKLILNWQETEKLVFTNHNRRKILTMDYSEFAQYLSNNSIMSVTYKNRAFEVIRSHLTEIIQQVKTQKEKVQKVEATKQKKLSSAYLSERKNAIQAALEQQLQRARIKHQKALILRKKAKKKIMLAQEAVSKLNVDAWLNLPLMEGVLTPCRLVAIVSAADTYIFTNRTGIKVAEHTASQLSQMIVTQNSEILDTGAEFENILATVISGLREDKDKSYDELSGTSS